MEIRSLEEALRDGCRLHGFRSGGGLRVIRVEDQKGALRGYGEHPHVEEALAHANEDLIAGGRPYKEVYGKSETHYLTGSCDASSDLDRWLLRGKDIDAFTEGREFVVQLRGLETFELPEMVRVLTLRSGRATRYHDRGIMYIARPSFFPNGEPCVSTTAILPLAQLTKDPWFYRVQKTGKADSLVNAMDFALRAEPVELSKDEERQLCRRN